MIISFFLISTHKTMKFFQNEKNVFNRTLSSVLKWKKKDIILHKKKKKKIHFLVEHLKIQKNKNLLKYKKINLNEIPKKKKNITFSQAFTIINKIRKKITGSYIYKDSILIPTNYFFWRLYYNLKILFFLIKVLQD